MFSEYYEINETRYFYNPNDTTNPAEAACYVHYEYDDFGQRVSQMKYEENGTTDTLLTKSWTVYNYSENGGDPYPTAPSYSFPTPTPAPYSFTQRFNVVTAQIVQQDTDPAYRETYFVYDSNRNISKIYSLKDDSSGDVFIET